MTTKKKSGRVQVLEFGGGETKLGEGYGVQGPGWGIGGLTEDPAV